MDINRRNKVAYRCYKQTRIGIIGLLTDNAPKR